MKPSNQACDAPSGDGGDVLEAVILWAYYQRVLPFAFSCGLTREDTEDLAHSVVVHLLEHALPAFDETRGNWGVYLTCCVRRAICDEFRALMRRRGLDAHHAHIAEQQLAGELEAETHVEQTAARLIEDPEQFLPPRDAAVLRALLHADRDTSKASIARDLGYSHASSLSRALARIRVRLVAHLQEAA